MVAREEYGGVLVQSESLEGLEYPTDLLVHKGNGRQVACPHPLLVVEKFVDPEALRVGVGNACFGHVVPVAFRHERKFYLLEGIGCEILLGSNVGIVGADEPGCQKEGFVVFLETFQQFD